jgi:hypothetical protein
MSLTCRQHHVSSHIPLEWKATEWKIRGKGNKFKSFGILQLRRWEQQSLSRLEVEDDEGGPDPEETMLDSSHDYEGMVTRVTTFGLFPEMTQELQDEVWDFFCNEPCRFEARARDGQNLVFVSEAPRIPPLLHTCHAARDSGRKKYLELPTTKGKTYFDPEVDIICFGYSCYNSASVIKWLAENTKVRYLEFRLMLFRIWCPNWRQHFFSVLHQYNNLKEVTFFAETRHFLDSFLEVFGEEVGKVPGLKFAIRKRIMGTHSRMMRAGDKHEHQ